MMRSEFKSAPPFIGALLTGFALDVEQGFGDLYRPDFTDSSLESIDLQLRKVTRDLVEAFTEAARKGEIDTKCFPGAPRDARKDSTPCGSGANAESIDFGAVKRMTLTELFAVSRPTSLMSSGTASAPTSSSSADLDSHATSETALVMHEADGAGKPLPFESVWQIHSLYEKLDSLKWNPGQPEHSVGMSEEVVLCLQNEGVRVEMPEEFVLGLQNENVRGIHLNQNRLKAFLRQLTRPFFYNYLPAFMLDLTELRGIYLTEVDNGAAIQNKVLAFVVSSSIALCTFVLKDERIGAQVNLLLKHHNITSAFHV